MRSFTDLDALIGRVPAHIVTRLSAIDFGRGSEALYRDQMPGLLTELADRARVQSITASSAIEGVVVADTDRAERIINRRTSRLRNRSEQELAGYRDAQDYLFQQEWRPLNAGLILHLHRLLFAHTAMPRGAFKTEDNLVVDRAPDGSRTVRFKPVSAARTPIAIDDLIDRYQQATAAGEHHPLLLSGLFILDLLVIHPFEDGNGRVARLLTNAMLTEHGYTVGRYVSLEQAVAESAEAYYQALLESTHGWHDGTADPWPWLGYFTSVIAGAYAVFADRAAAAKTPGTKQQRIREHILRHAPATFRLADIRTAVPGVSDQTIRLVLEQLKTEGKVRADGTGRTATWTRTNTAPTE
ncbi:MAG TPA: Fic family protein [Streptosporangiaceae bacterium]|nr:Fic family protein [Streptosporangiaceae bacterium]